MIPGITNTGKGVIIGVCGLAAAGATLWFLGLGPLVSAYTSVSEDATRLAEAETERDAARARITALAAERATLTEQIAGLSYEPRPVSELNDYLAEVVAGAAKAGLAVDVIEPGEPVPGELSDDVEISLIGRGTTPALARWLHEWNRASPDSSVRGMRLNTARSEGEGGAVHTLRFEIDLVWMAAPTGGSAAVASSEDVP